MTLLAIRPLTPADIPIVARWIVNTPLWQRYHLQEAQTRTNLERGLQNNDVLLVADTDTGEGQACGLAWCVLKGAFGRSPYLRLLGVRDGQSGQGVGAALLEHAEHAVSTASNELFLLTSDFNFAAQRFYERQGYQHIGAIPGYVLPDVTELIYWKQLHNGH